MKLLDVLLTIGDGTLVRVFNNECEEIANYDGKNSIPVNLNDHIVETVFPAGFGILNIILV